MEGGQQKVRLLRDDEALLLRARESVTVETSEKDELSGLICRTQRLRLPGDKWMEYGPSSYIPPIEVEVLQFRQKIPLHSKEGIYVRDTKSGLVRLVLGESYMLKTHEELHEIELGDTVSGLLQHRNHKYNVISYKCPYNSAVQVYDYKKKTSRIVLGPQLVLLSPDEQFTVNILSGAKPKKVGVIKTINVQLGPDFSTDIINVETSDHAALKLQLSYNWVFKFNENDQNDMAKIFNVRDFIGDMCNLMAAKVRSAVASVDFDTFHKTSAKVIRKAIFGIDSNGKINNSYCMTKNNLHITNVDIQNAEPIDEETRNSLQKTVTQAIEITTKRQEQQARNQAAKLAQESIGVLKKLKIEDESRAEEAKTKLVEVESRSKAVVNQGKAIANAKAEMEAENILAEGNLKVAALRAEASKIERMGELERVNKRNVEQYEYRREMDGIEILRSQRLSEIESGKFEEMVKAVGQETLVAMASAGPEFQAKLLEGLGLKGFVMTDGNNPINLFTTAQGLLEQR